MKNLCTEWQNENTLRRLSTTTPVATKATTEWANFDYGMACHCPLTLEDTVFPIFLDVASTRVDFFC